MWISGGILPVGAYRNLHPSQATDISSRATLNHPNAPTHPYNVHGWVFFLTYLCVCVCVCAVATRCITTQGIAMRSMAVCCGSGIENVPLNRTNPGRRARVEGVREPVFALDCT